MDDDTSGAFDEARDDLRVAAVAAGCAVAVSLGLYALDRSAPMVVRIAPLFIYFGYLFVRKRSPDGPLGSIRNWIGLTVLVSAVAFVGYAV